MEEEETTTTTEVSETVCELCSDGSKNEKASTYCTDCQQRFCSRCVRKHSSQKASKQHRLIDIAEMQMLLDSSIEELCESCLNMEESNPAIMYCVECDEKLCKECSTLHGKMKMTKLHSRITIEEFKKMQQSLKVLCTQCNENGKQTEANQYCPLCKEDLCLECTQIHKRFKATKQHELVDIQSEQTDLKLNKGKFARSCEPCEASGKENIASDVCKECEEFLCETCAQTHKMQKATKMHHLIKAENVLQEYCEPCMSKGEHATASRLCNHCEELLCSSCSVMHASFKGTKSHTLGDIPLKIPDPHSCYPCKVSGREVNAVCHCAVCEEYYCSACRELHSRQKATLSHYLVKVAEMAKLKNDEDYKRDEVGSDEQKSEFDASGSDKPKSKFEKTRQSSHLQQDMMPGTPIAKDVQSHSHKRSGSIKQHELVDIQREQTDPKLNKGKLARSCEPCKFLKKENITSDICKECEEFLCEICARTHEMQKATKMHHLIKAENVLQEYCEICMSKGEHATASRLCNQCGELLCSSCSEMHVSFKATKSHTLGDIPLKIPDLHSCYPCKVNGREVNAVCHCEDCEKYYCSTCGELHSRKNATLSHNLVKVAEMGKPKNKKDYKGDETGSDDQNSEFEKPQQKSCLQQNMVPGTPRAHNIQSDSLELTWQKPAYLEYKKESQYQIRYKEEANPRWSFYPVNPERAYVKIKGLKSKCSYVFQVRSITEDFEGPYSSESEAITTTHSLASRLLIYTEKVKEGRPSIHRILSTEIEGARNNTAKTRKFEIGKQPISNVKEKTILLVGATGSGKSTLVDGIINYVAGVNWKDPYRFTLIYLESDEENKTQALSQTEWVTCYTIHPEDGSRLDYTLNIIDTPGFGNTRGSARDQQIVDQLRELFSSEGRKGVVFIDAVCFLMKAPDARLTSVEKYMFMSILSLFGKDIEDNICTLITFADGKKPPILSAMDEAKLPVKFWYVFNNSGLFEENEQFWSF